MQWAVPTPSSRSPRLSFRYSFQVVLGFFALLPSLPLVLSNSLLLRLLFPSAFPFGSASVPAFFPFGLSAFRPSTLSSFFPAGLSGFFPSAFFSASPFGSASLPASFLPFRSLFRTRFRSGFSGFFRIFSNPENDTDETLTTSGVSRGDFC